MIEFKTAETNTFSKQINSPKFRNIYPKIKNYIYPQLRHNPFYGLNIKKLKDDLADTYRYRIGNYRLFYEIDAKNNTIVILSIKSRKDAYEK